MGDVFYTPKMLKVKLAKARTVHFMTLKRYAGSYPKVKNAILTIVLMIVAMYVWNDVINLLKEYQVDIRVKNDIAVTTTVGSMVTPKAEAEGLSTSNLEETTSVEVSKVSSVDMIAAQIWMNESTNGKNNYSKCEEKGLINGIGYGIPGNGDYQCFKSHTDEMTVLKGWIISKQAQGMSEKELMCLYSGNNYLICK